MRIPIFAICEEQRRRSACASAHCAVHFVDSIISMLAKFKLLRLQLFSVAKQASLRLTLSKPLKTGFLMTWLI